jgi:hypothetical protein
MMALQRRWGSRYVNPRNFPHEVELTQTVSYDAKGQLTNDLLQLPTKLCQMKTYALPACPGLQPVCRITQEQVRSHVLCESPPDIR